MAEVFKDKKIRGIMLMLTYQCNLNCLYCYEKHKSSKTMSLDIAKSIVTKAFSEIGNQYDELHIHLMGGEPLLQFDTIKELAEWTWQQQWNIPYLFVAPTNGTLLDENMKKWFFDNKDRIVLGLSFDGNVNMQNINRSNSSNRIDYQFFVNTWPDRTIKMTVSPETIGYLYDGIISLYDKGFKKIDAELAHGVAWNDSHLEIYSKQLDKLIDYYLLNHARERVSLLNVDITKVLNRDIPNKKCGCGQNFHFYDCNGDVYPCQLFSPATMPQSMIEETQKIDFTDDSLFTNDRCKECLLRPLCIGCCGMNYLYMKDVGKTPTFFCKAFIVQFMANCKLNRKMLSINSNKKQDEIEQVLTIVSNSVKLPLI